MLFPKQTATRALEDLSGMWQFQAEKSPLAATTHQKHWKGNAYSLQTCLNVCSNHDSSLLSSPSSVTSKILKSCFLAR